MTKPTLVERWITNFGQGQGHALGKGRILVGPILGHTILHPSSKGYRTVLRSWLDSVPRFSFP